LVLKALLVYKVIQVLKEQPVRKVQLAPVSSRELSIA